MIAIAVDDEALMLGALVAAIEASPDISKIAKFSDCEEALEFVKNNHTDVAFLDINMRGMGGLALAERIIAARPDCKIVFCSHYLDGDTEAQQCKVTCSKSSGWKEHYICF